MKFKFLVLCACLSFTSIYCQDRVYIDSSDLEISEDVFYIHLGGNMWRETNGVFTDETGLFIFESKTSKDFQKKWKCPYCHMMWPIKSPCGNPDCPSKYSKIKK